ncbi:MAG: ATP-binding protein [Candidatus Xenobiia bacterium LiM19]
MSRIFTADFSQFRDIISYIREGLLSSGCDDDVVNTAHVICDEFITNIIKNAYHRDVSDTHCIDGTVYAKPLNISYAKTLNQLSIELTDWGAPFNPLEYSGESSDEETHGGCGIHIARNLADSISYAREADKNILTFFIHTGD